MKRNIVLPYHRVKSPVMKQGRTTAKIRVRLNNRTVITIQDMSALALWKVKYPDATVMSDKKEVVQPLKEVETL